MHNTTYTTTMCTDVFTNTEVAAAISFDAARRYILRRGQARRLGFIMLNPSTADSHVDDPTIRKCVGFASRLGYEGIIVGNLFSWRATDPLLLMAAINRGEAAAATAECNDALRQVMSEADGIVFAWGAHVNDLALARHALPRIKVVEVLASAAGKQPVALGWTKGTRTKPRQPRHPLRLPYKTELTPYLNP